MKIGLPYGKKTLSVDIPKNNLLDVIYPNEIIPEFTAEEYIRLALDKPMGTKRLHELAKKGNKVAIVVDDYTRPCPTWAMLPSVLKEIYSSGIKENDVTIIFATGSHREVKQEEASRLLGGDYADRLNYISNNFKGNDFTYAGSTSKGTDVKVKNAFIDADIRILLGDVEIHYFAGYGGGRKSILPGISHYSTIQDNYQKNFFHHASKPGVLDSNPMYENMTEGARLANPNFCLNIVQNSKNEIVGAFAGDFDMVLRKGAFLVDKMYKIKIREKADIVITSADGSPHDVNLYQAYKAIHLSLNAVKDNGIIILAAECPDGHGSQLYYEWMKKYTKEEMEERLGKEFTIGGHKAYYHLKALEKAEMFIVSDMDKDMLKNVFRMDVFPSLNNALEQAFKEKGETSKVLVIPKGTTTLIE
ncbi:MAG: nickel-dependent lactate racemase [Candidatus Thermoplasmatota archaeon]|nr:nickel-dependent lactate racemase [Candidatus Thermoplasmatota archaeon]MBU4255977.1 nickel-dependent lactate racemase [Candidatus Thermoplasmatota archaeon]